MAEQGSRCSLDVRGFRVRLGDFQQQRDFGVAWTGRSDGFPGVEKSFMRVEGALLSGPRDDDGSEKWRCWVTGERWCCGWWLA